MFENEGQSCWESTAQLPSFPALDRSLEVDAVIVGGGIAGITTAYLLKQAGLRVALLERRRCGSGQTGRSTAHLTAIADQPLATLVDELGTASARTLWEAGFAAVARVRAEIRDARINCQFAWVRGCLHASSSDEVRQRASLTEEAVAAHALGIEAAYVDAVPGLGVPGVLFDGQARLHPLRYLTVLLESIDGNGSLVAQHTEVDRLDADRRVVYVGRHQVRAPFIFCATHVPLPDVLDLAPHLRSSLSTSTTYVVAGTAPQGPLDEGLYWEHRHRSYEYLRIDREDGQDDVVVFGGLDHPGDSAAAGDRYSRLERRLRQRLPGVRIEHRWSGTVVESVDGRPCIGEVAPGIYLAAGFGGNGMSYGTLAAMMAVEAVRGGRSAWADLFDPSRFSDHPREPDASSAAAPSGHVTGRRPHATVA